MELTSSISPQATFVDYFIPDTETGSSARAIAAYLRAYAPAGTLVVDPFCQSPDIVREALASGHHVIAISFNPLDALRTRLALSSIPAHDLETAVTRVADSLKAGVPLREHLQRLYRTTCPQCGKEVIADYFVWERDSERPHRVHYHCAACGDTGLRDCDENDFRVLQEVQPRGLHYWHMLDRVVGPEGRARKFAASLLELYTPRNLYVLSNILLKVENLFSGSRVHDYLRLGLLHALEQGSKLHPAPSEPALPHAPGLHPPSHWVEWNAWQLFEDATRRLAQDQPAAPVALAASVQELLPAASTSVEAGQSTGPAQNAGWSTDSPQKPAGPARAFVGHLTVRQLAPALPSGSVSLIWAQPPTRGRTQWALPYLWTGWLYGHKEAASLWPLVRRRRSDWTWYLQAMRGTLLALQKTLQADGHLVLVSRNKGLAHHEALTLAAAGASLRLESTLYHTQQPEATRPFGGLRGDYRSVWVPGPPAPAFPMSMADLEAKLHDVAMTAAEETLQARGEAAPFVRLHCHIWEALARRGILQRIMTSKELPTALDWLRKQIQKALQSQIGSTFVQWGETESRHLLGEAATASRHLLGEAATASRHLLGEAAPEGECLWWLVHAADVPPLTERVERAVYEALAAVHSAATTEILETIYAHFPGMLTPDGEWVLACLRSYGQQITPGRWALQEAERPGERAKAREKTLYVLQDLGQRWGYEVKLAQGLALRWVQRGKQPVIWAILDTAALSLLVDKVPSELTAAARKLAIISDARQDLMSLRWRWSPLLRQELVARDWQFIHEQDLIHWAQQHNITLSDLDTLVSLDPLAIHGRTQLPLM
jgi:predicted RNA-binding Zn-ribbon protein involved in translation (DUF1610 family)